MKVSSFKEVNMDTIHVYSAWHSVPDGYDSTLDVWREFIVDDFDVFAEDDDVEEWKEDLRAHVEAAAKKEFPYVMWENIEIWYYIIFNDAAHKIVI